MSMLFGKGAQRARSVSGKLSLQRAHRFAGLAVVVAGALNQHGAPATPRGQVVDTHARRRFYCECAMCTNVNAVLPTNRPNRFVTGAGGQTRRGRS